MLQEVKTLTERAWNDKTLLNNTETKDAVNKIIELLDKGNVRVAEPSCAGEWLVNEWIKKGVILYFDLQNKNSEIALFDNIPIKEQYNNTFHGIGSNVIIKFGAYIDKDVTLMPCYINIGSHIESGSLIDSFASINSCAQIGKNVHISEGVVIGGVLEPPHAPPVIIEDGCFIGSNSSITGGVCVQKESIIAANIAISGSTKIIDVTGPDVVEYKALIPPYSIVTPGVFKQKFKCGEYQIQCALIVGKRKKSKELKTSLTEAIMNCNISV